VDAQRATARSPSPDTVLQAAYQFPRSYVDEPDVARRRERVAGMERRGMATSASSPNPLTLTRVNLLGLFVKPMGKIITALSSWNSHWVTDIILGQLQLQII
jgi:hypothetical protein